MLNFGLEVWTGIILGYIVGRPNPVFCIINSALVHYEAQWDYEQICREESWLFTHFYSVDWFQRVIVLFPGYLPSPYSAIGAPIEYASNILHVIDHIIFLAAHPLAYSCSKYSSVAIIFQLLQWRHYGWIWQDKWCHDFTSILRAIPAIHETNALREVLWHRMGKFLLKSTIALCRYKSPLNYV